MLTYRKQCVILGVPKKILSVKQPTQATSSESAPIRMSRMEYFKATQIVTVEVAISSNG